MYSKDTQGRKLSALSIAITLAIFFLFLFSGYFLSIEASETYSTDEVAKHNTEDNCWVILDNRIYNITSYIPDHDQYLDIRSWCGKDMTEDFKTKAGRGTNHKLSSYNLLETMYIGDLVGETPASTTNQDLTDHNNDSISFDSLDLKDYSVEISGSDMKKLTIQEIAKLWEINDYEYLQELTNKFHLKGTYSTENTLDDLRAEYKFSPAQAKDVAEIIRQGDIDKSTVTKNTQKPKSPYNLAIPLLFSIILYVGSYLILRSQWGRNSKYFNQHSFNFAWNTILLLSLIPAFGFGIIMMLSYQFPAIRNINFNFIYWHVELSVVMGTVALMHFIQRYKAYWAPIKILQIKGKKKTKS